jgi:hypothetical protein
VIIEQAFFNMPEILSGYGFPSQDYEGGIVGAFSLAVLQELNGRNVNNPISLMRMETPFRDRKKPWLTSGGKKRYLRCDLHINTSRIGVGSKALAAYGWRHSNWIEAKFFRAFDRNGLPIKSSNMTVNTASLLADLVRLLALVPDMPDKSGRSVSGRYLLHIYLNKPEDHISTRRKSGGKFVPRPWVQAITQPGENKLSMFSIRTEASGVRDSLGSALNALSFEMEVTNFVAFPMTKLPGQPQFAQYLTRIDSFKLEYERNWWGIDKERLASGSNTMAYKSISDFVGAGISLAMDSEERPIPKNPDDGRFMDSPTADED